MQYNTLQYNTIQYNTIQYNTITLVNEILRGIWCCLKRDLDIDREAMLSDIKTALTFTPVLKRIEITKQLSIRWRLNPFGLKTFLN